MIRPISPERLEAIMRGDVLRDASGTAPPLTEHHRRRLSARHVNLDTVAMLATGAVVLRYRRRKFLVPPVPYRDGLELAALEDRLASLGAEEGPEDAAFYGEMYDVLTALVERFHALVRPLTPLDKLLWRWLSNPFANATEGEVARLLGFFSAARMQSATVASSSAADVRPGPESPEILESHPPSTRPTTSRSSAGSSRRGWVPTASRARGRTTSSASARSAASGRGSA